MNRFRLVVLLLLLCNFSLLFAAQSIKDAIAANDLPEAKRMATLLKVDFKSSPFLADYLQATPSIDSKMLEWLLISGSNPDALDQTGVGPLYWAIVRNNAFAVTALIKAKANVNASWKGERSFNWRGGDSLWNSNINFYKPYIFPYYDVTKNSWADYNLSAGSSQVFYLFNYVTLSPVSVALFSKDRSILASLLEAKANPLPSTYQIKDPKSKKVLYSNTLFDFIQGGLLLCEDRINNCAQNDQLKLTDTTLAFVGNVATWLQAMEKLPKSQQAKFPKKVINTTLYALLIGNIDLFRNTLASFEGDASIWLPYALQAGQWPSVELVLALISRDLNESYKFYYNTQDFEISQPLLSWAVSFLDPEAVKLLLENKAQLQTRANYLSYIGNNSPIVKDGTLLSCAIYNNEPRKVKLLLAADVSPNDPEAIAASHFRPENRQVLVDAGLPIDTVITYTMPSNHSRYFDLSATETASWKFSGSLLFDAANSGSDEAVRYWLEKGLDPNGGSTSNANPLLAAICQGRPRSVQALLDKGASPLVSCSRVFILSQIEQFEDCSRRIDYSKLIGQRALDLAKAWAEDRQSDSTAGPNYSQIVKMIETSSSSCKSEFPVGSKGPSGGVVIYDKGYTSEGWRYIEAAPETLWEVWIPDTQGSAEQYNQLVAKKVKHLSFDPEYGGGKSNTYDLYQVWRDGDNAASLAKKASFGGNSEWYIPNDLELLAYFKVLKYMSTATENGSHDSANAYWSSDFSNYVPVGFADGHVIGRGIEVNYPLSLILIRQF